MHAEENGVLLWNQQSAGAEILNVLSLLLYILFAHLSALREGTPGLHSLLVVTHEFLRNTKSSTVVQFVCHL